MGIFDWLLRRMSRSKETEASSETSHRCCRRRDGCHHRHRGKTKTEQQTEELTEAQQTNNIHQSDSKIESSLDEQIIQLRKELKKAKDDCDDAIEERDEYESRLKKSQRTVLDLQEQVMDFSDKHKKLIKEFNEAQTMLSKKELDLGKKNTSLSFVQEILTADLATSESLIEENKKIDNVCNFISSDLQDLCKRYFPNKNYSSIFDSGLKQWEAVARKSWIRNKKTIAFVGEFSAGKTTIVNRFLLQNNANANLLPVDAKASTAIPTYISGGDYSAYRFYTPEGKLKEISEESFKKVSKETLENVQGISELIKYFVMTCPNPNLEEISILDTPGFSSGDKEDSIRTIDVVNECDALLWVIDFYTGTVNRSSLNIIKKHMKKPLYVIINKTDNKAESDIIDVERQVMETFDEEGVKIERCIRFSDLTPIDEILNLFDAIRNDTSAEKYLNTLTMDFLPALIKECKHDLKSATDELVDSNDKCDNKIRSINALCHAIQNDSENAAGKFHWEHYRVFWREDHYAMSKTEGEELKDLLFQISKTEVKKLQKEVDEYGSLMQKNQKAYEKKNEMQNKLNLFRDAETKLNRLINELKQQYYDSEYV